VAELRAERSTSRPERPYRAIVGEGQKYVAEMQRLTEEHDDLVTRQAAEAGPRKMGAKAEVPPRVIELRDRMAELVDVMGEYEGELTIRATKTDGEWEQWRIANPAREEGEPGHRDDLLVTGGYCNADALMADLATYVAAWNGEPLEPGDFDTFNLGRPDKKAIAATVVGLYETGDDLPKLRSGLSALLKSEAFSRSPEPSE
jgi:hypothetical protein